MTTIHIENADCIEYLKSFESNSIDCVYYRSSLLY